jgi:hypothetical protein
MEFSMFLFRSSSVPHESREKLEFKIDSPPPTMRCRQANSFRNLFIYRLLSGLFKYLFKFCIGQNKLYQLKLKLLLHIYIYCAVTILDINQAGSQPSLAQRATFMLTYHQGQKKLNILPSGFLLFVEYATLNRKKIHIIINTKCIHASPPPPIQSRFEVLSPKLKSRYGG